MFNSNTGVGIWTSRLPIPIIYGRVEQDDVCESSGVEIKKIKALADPQGTISFPCGVICDHFHDQGRGKDSRSLCEKSLKKCELAPWTWDGKKIQYT